MELLCGKSHTHKPWNATRDRGGWSFATAQECAYHPKLCAAIVTAVQKALETSGLQVVIPASTAKPKPRVIAEDKAARAAATATAGRQPRGRSFAQLIPDCKEWTRLFLRSLDDHRLAQLIAPHPSQPTLINGVVIPANSVVHPSPSIAGEEGGGGGG